MSSGSLRSYVKFQSGCRLSRFPQPAIAHEAFYGLRILGLGRWWWTRTRPCPKSLRGFVFWEVVACTG